MAHKNVIGILVTSEAHNDLNRHGEAVTVKLLMLHLVTVMCWPPQGEQAARLPRSSRLWKSQTPARIALRVNGVLSWLATDHPSAGDLQSPLRAGLGSTAVTADGGTGVRTGELWYKPLRQAQGGPWGESRVAPTSARLRLRRACGVSAQTSASSVEPSNAQSSRSPKSQRRFTGQVLDNVAGGLYFYNARYYDPALGRFTQADTIVPQPGNPQSLNRYSYALNNATRFTDPTGHVEEGEAEEAKKVIKLLFDLYGILIDIDFGWQPVLHPAPGQPGQIWIKGGWELADLKTVQNAVSDFAAKAGGTLVAHTVLGGVTIRRGSNSFQLRSGIELTDSTFNQAGVRKEFGPKIAVVHELAHYWDWKTGSFWSKMMNTPGALVNGITAPVGIGNESAPTLYGQTNEQEDWAETVAMYVYPEYQQILLSENNPFEVQPNVGRPGLGIRHATYVKTQFEALSGGRGWR